MRRNQGVFVAVALFTLGWLSGAAEACARKFIRTVLGDECCFLQPYSGCDYSTITNTYICKGSCMNGKCCCATFETYQNIGHHWDCTGGTGCSTSCDLNYASSYAIYDFVAESCGCNCICPH